MNCSSSLSFLSGVSSAAEMRVGVLGLELRIGAVNVCHIGLELTFL
jgi:hypothetical protein